MTEPNNKHLSETLQPLSGQRQKSETDAAVTACNDWLRMGAGRSLRELVDEYEQKQARNKRFHAPSTSYSTIRQWAANFEWASRASAYDADFEKIKNEERQQVFNQALALDFGRVRKLVDLAKFLEEQLYEYSEDEDTGKRYYHNVWNPDVKSVGSGEFAERVDIERFNSAIIQQYRETLADIAKEVGGRVQKNEHTGANGGAIEIAVRKLPDLPDDTLDEILNGNDSET